MVIILKIFTNLANKGASVLLMELFGLKAQVVPNEGHVAQRIHC
jgi:hypothetical protein